MIKQFQSRQLGRLPGALEVKVSPKENAYHGPLVAYLRPDQIEVLTHLTEGGREQIGQMIEQGLWQKLEKDGLLERYRQEHRLPQDWPFGEQRAD
jgi:hypothetical protein